MTDDEPDVCIGWEVIDFRPDSSGWLAIYLQPEPLARVRWYTEPVVGWLIQEARPYDFRTMENLDLTDERIPDELMGRLKARQVVAAVVEGSHVEPVDFIDTFWQLVPPGADFNPPLDEIDDRRARNHEPTPRPKAGDQTQRDQIR